MEVRYSPGNPAAISFEKGLRPVALRPILSGGLPLSVINFIE
jgi:hypothetical protein